MTASDPKLSRVRGPVHIIDLAHPNIALTSCLPALCPVASALLGCGLGHRDRRQSRIRHDCLRLSPGLARVSPALHERRRRTFEHVAHSWSTRTGVEAERPDRKSVV